MPIVREARSSDSPLVHRIARVTYTGDINDVSIPDGLWDLVFVRKSDGRISVLQTGLNTEPVVLDYSSGDQYLSISFAPGVFMPRLPGSLMVNRAVHRPLVSPGYFWLYNDRLEVPTFENSEGLVARLVARGHVAVDQIVVRALADNAPGASTRTVQRHFRQTVGIPLKHLELIQRANRAVELLRQGMPPATVAVQVGYADQSHLSRSLRQIVGRTPGEVMRTVGS